MEKRRLALILAAILLLLTGCGQREDPVSATYTCETILPPEKDTDTLELQRSIAQWYNLNLLLEDPEEDFTEAYSTILFYQDGIMGSVEIPSVGLHLPIYHGTDSTTLRKGMGHMPSSAFPIGGEGNHAVLVYRNRESPDFSEGDIFYIHILDEILAYEIELLHSLDGEYMGRILPEEGKDMCSILLPSAGILVRGIRTEIPESEQGK